MLIPEGEAGDRLLEELAVTLQGRLVNRIPAWVTAVDRARQELLAAFPHGSLEAFGCQGLPGALGAAGAVLHYLAETQKGALPHLQPLRTFQTHDFMLLDDFTRRNLELTGSLLDGGRRGSLLGVLDRTVTAMGARKLRHWIAHPLVELDAIRRRHEAVGELVDSSLLRGDLRAALDGVYDLERLNARIAMATGNAKDLVALNRSLERLPGLLDAAGAMRRRRCSRSCAAASIRWPTWAN